MNKMIPSEEWSSLNKSIHTDENGNVEIKGTTKLNGGLEPIHTYKLDGVTTLYVYFEHPQYGDFIGYGWITNIGTPRPCIFHYALQDGKVIRFRGLSDDIIYEYNSNSNLTKTFTIAKKSECQPKLYTHTLTLTTETNNYVLMYDCSSNTPANSVQDLRTLMNISSASDSIILPVVNPTDLSTAGLQVTTSICKIGTSNVTAVSDSVTQKL